MNKVLYIAVFMMSLFRIFAADLVAEKHAIACDDEGGRFGDKVLYYAQAKYLSHISSVAFLHRPFEYSDYLNIEKDEYSFEQRVKSYKNVVHINSYETLTRFFHLIRDPTTPPTLFILKYSPTDISEWDRRGYDFKLLFHVPWDDDVFMDQLKKSLTPKKQIPDLRMKDMLNVAIHYRTLSGPDTPEVSMQFLPLKHPKLEYHERQIRKVYEWNLARPMNVFIFTDAKNPKDVQSKLIKKFEGYNITFNIQEQDQVDVNYVIEDFFAMQKFDVLIATQSNYSMMASRLGTFDMIITPVHLCGQYPNYTVDRVQVVSSGASWFPYKFDMIFKD